MDNHNSPIGLLVVYNKTTEMGIPYNVFRVVLISLDGALVIRARRQVFKTVITLEISNAVSSVIRGDSSCISSCINTTFCVNFNQSSFDIIKVWNLTKY